MRYGIPALIAVGGVVALAIGGTGSGLGVVLIGSAFMVLLINVLFRVSIVSNHERDEEERAREHFDRTGRWPGE